jgi:nitrite reductase/ring-hydroxylating ferredoxin subunit
MSLPAADRVWICASNRIAEGAYLKAQVRYDGEPVSVVVFRHGGQCRAFKNLCVHMPRALDCEQDMIFDATGRYLRCSMHGIVYDPVSGTSLSEICRGQRLTSIDVVEDEQGIWLVDRHVRPLPSCAA